MAPTVFVTGIAGFVGGNTVSYLVEKHPDYKIIGLVHNEEQAKLLKLAGLTLRPSSEHSTPLKS